MNSPGGPETSSPVTSVTSGRWLLGYWVAWIVLGLYTASWDAASGAVGTGIAFWRTLLPLNILQAGTWGVAGLGVLAVARRYPIDRTAGRLPLRWGVNVANSTLFAVAGLLGTWLIALAFVGAGDRAKLLAHPVEGLIRFASMYLHLNLLLMWTVLGVYHGFRLKRKYDDSELRAARLSARVAEAQNRALRMQLQPHFLFNTLNSIASLIYSDPAGADLMLTRLAELLRLSLTIGENHVVPLSQELAFVQRYLAIEQVRFQDRLEVRYRVEPDCLVGSVPALLLQPLVENSIKHGISDCAGRATVEIRASRRGEWLDLEVEDSGRGYGGGREGIGTANTAARLALLYPERHQFVLSGGPDQGAVAFVRVPWSRAEA
jgi:two-component system LytT family sensor kinase